MPTTVDVPDFGSIDFPDEMSLGDITSALRKQFPPQSESESKWVIQDTLSRLGKGVAEQGGQAIQGVSRGLSIASAQAIPANLRALQMQAEMAGADTSSVSPIITKAAKESPARALQATPESPFYQFGRDIEEAAKDFYQPNPKADDSIRAKLIQGVASTVPVLASGPLAPITYGAMMGEQGAREAEEKGASPEQISDTFLANAALGVTSEFLLGVPYLLRSVKAIKGAGQTLSKTEIGKRLAAISAKHPVASLAARGAIAEAIQEGPIEQVGQNAIAKFVGQYDTDRPIFQDVAEQAAYGAAIGFLLGGLFGGAAKIDRQRALAAHKDEFQDPVTGEWLSADDYTARQAKATPPETKIVTPFIPTATQKSISARLSQIEQEKGPRDIFDPVTRRAVGGRILTTEEIRLLKALEDLQQQENASQKPTGEKAAPRVKTTGELIYEGLIKQQESEGQNALKIRQQQESEERERARNVAIRGLTTVEAIVEAKRLVGENELRRRANAILNDPSIDRSEAQKKAVPSEAMSMELAARETVSGYWIERPEPKAVDPLPAQPAVISRGRFRPAPVSQITGRPQTVTSAPTVAQPATVETPAMTVEEHASVYPVVKPDALVDGRRIINAGTIPNMSSIGSSIDNPRTLSGIREVPMSDFTLTGRHYSVEGQRRIDALAEAINESGEITPLIVVRDSEGAYILEGATRADALFKLGAKSFPAKVVVDVGEIESKSPAKPPVEAPVAKQSLTAETPGEVRGEAKAPDYGAQRAAVGQQLGDVKRNIVRLTKERDAKLKKMGAMVPPPIRLEVAQKSSERIEKLTAEAERLDKEWHRLNDLEFGEAEAKAKPVTPRYEIVKGGDGDATVIDREFPGGPVVVQSFPQKDGAERAQAWVNAKVAKPVTSEQNDLVIPESVEANELRITKEKRGLGRLNQERLEELEKKEAADFENQAASEATRATEAWGKHSVEVVEPLRQQVRKLGQEVQEMAYDAKRTLPTAKGKQKLTKKAFLKKYGVASMDDANAIFKSKNEAWAEKESQLEAAEIKFKELEQAKTRRSKEWSQTVTRRKEAELQAKQQTDLPMAAAPQQGASTVQPDKIDAALTRAIDATDPFKGGQVLEGVTGAPIWLTKTLANGALRVLRAAYRAGKNFAQAVSETVEWIRAQQLKDFNEQEVIEWLAYQTADEELGGLVDELGVITPGDDEEGVRTKVGNVHDKVLTRIGLKDAVREDSVANAQNALNEAGLVVARHDDGLFELVDSTASQEQGGQNLVTILEREIQSARAENRPERVANLLNTVVVHLARDKNQAFSQATKNRLYALAQGERSTFGRALGSLAMWGRVLANVAQNPSIHLNRIYSQNLGGEEISEVMERLRKILGGSPTAQEIEDALTKVQAEFSKKSRMFEKGNKLWGKIQKAARAGLFDPGPILEDLARGQGWTVPTEGQKAWLRAQVAEEERLRTPTQRQIDNAGGDIDKATAEAAKGTESDRLKIIKDIQAHWSRWSMPISWNPFKWTAQTMRNNARAVNEFVAANFLFTPGFPVRQWMDVILTSLPLNAVNRTLVHVLERAQNDGGFSVDTTNDLYAASEEMLVSRIASLKATIRAMERTAGGHLNRKVLERMTHSVGVFERMRVKANDLKANGNLAGYWALRFASILQAGYRVASVFDESQATGLEWQEMRQQLATDLRAQGKNRADISTQLDDILGGIRVDMVEAVAEVTAIKHERGLPLDKKAIEQDAWALIKARAYDRMRQATGTDAQYEAENTQLRELHSWNLPETGGIGGAIAGTINFIKRYTEKAGIPTGGLFSFGNAMGIAANRMATFSGGGLFGGFGFGDSPWYQGPRNVKQRRIEAIEGLAVMGLMVALAAAGKILIMTRYPDDKDEKERFIAEGHKLNTVRFIQDDGRWIEYPIQMSPFSFIASPLYMIGGIQRLLIDQQKAQERLNAEAAKTGATPGQAKTIGPGDVAGVIAQGMYGMLTGGRTATGAIQSFSDYGDFNLSRASSSLVRGYIPGVPAWQTVSRMMGVAMDSKTASVFEQLFPVPGSQHQRVNSLGDPMVNANDAIRVLQVLTAGVGFGSEADRKNDYAYRQLAAAGYAAPAIGRGKGYNFGGTVRPLTPKEYERYAAERGKAFKQELEQLGSLDGLDSADARKAAQGAFQRANQRALASVGVSEVKPKRAYTRRLRSVGGITRRGRSSFGRIRRGRAPSFGKLRTARAPRLKRAVLSDTRKPRVQRIVPANY